MCLFKKRHRNLIKDRIYRHHLLFFEDKEILNSAIDNIVGKNIFDVKNSYPHLKIVVNGEIYNYVFTRNRLHVNINNENIITEITSFG
jgi:hypothetical protein